VTVNARSGAYLPTTHTLGDRRVNAGPGGESLIKNMIRQKICNGWCCIMPVPPSPETEGWRDGYCLDCVTEMDRAEFRDNPENWTHEERAQHAREIAADSDMRRVKE